MGPLDFTRFHNDARQGAIPGIPASWSRSRYFTFARPGCFLVLACILMMLFAACNLGGSSSSSGTSQKASLSTSNGTITYSTSSQDVLIRTFYGGGNLGSLEMSPDISIYGDGMFILGPGLQMQEGRMEATSLQQLLNTVVDSDNLLKLSQQTFYDIPDQNATVLLLSVNGKQYQYIYGPFGNLPESESAQALADYKSQDSALLVHQDFNPNLTQNIPTWSLNDFTLYQAATFECGIIPQDITSPNADTGCLIYTVPHSAILLSAQQSEAISRLLNGQQEGGFMENGIYYQIMLRPLLPDELPQELLAMYEIGRASCRER